MVKNYILGIDTSNYKTSIAVTDENQSIVCDVRKLLEVKQGEKGLRQSDALFQHVKNLPVLMEEVRSRFDGHLSAVAYSSRPRPLEGSYMPVFLAGESFARSIAATLKIPAYNFSHQEGHIEAVKAYSYLYEEEELLACHFSGGTSELLKVRKAGIGYDISIIGGSKDIAFGQVLDRAGVMLGISFPAGAEMDDIALNAKNSTKLLTPVKVKDSRLNLSGIDTQIKRIIENTDLNIKKDMLIKEVFEKISDSMFKMVCQGVEISGCNKVLMSGGVCSSGFIRNSLADRFDAAGIDAVFDTTDLSQDNAVGISLLGGKAYGIETC